MKRFFSVCMYLMCIAPALLVVNGCSSDTTTRNIAEGIIEYKAVPADPKSSMAMMAPDKMTVKFKDDYSLAEMTAGLGALHMAFVSDPKKKEFINLVSFLGKHACVMNAEEMKKANHYFPEYTVSYPKETKLIAGYTCHKAVLSFSDGSPAMEAWYTKDIGIKNPNWSNAYYQIDGVLMEYQLKKYGMELHFTATSVAAAKVDPSIFTCPSDYKKTSPEELDKMFKGFY